MSKSGPEKLKMEPAEMTVENIEKIAGLFPGVVTEIEDEDGKLRKGIDFDLLKQELSGDFVEGREERYEFTWVGKKQSIVEANKPIQKTLRPSVDESKDWENTKNIFIEGDNLEALKLLQESYLNKVKMIYIDPPYNTGNDFIYNDSFVMDSDEYDVETNAVDEEGNRLIKNTKDRGRYHSDWCSMLYPRLKLAHNLLRDDGFIIISIDDNELSNLRKMCDEIFGEDNFRNAITSRRYDKNINRQFIDNGLTSLNIGLEFALVYSKNNYAKMNPVFKEASDERANNGYWKGFWNNADRPTMRYDILGYTPETGQWKWKEETAREALANYQEYLKTFSKGETLEEYWDRTGRKLKFIRRQPNGSGKNKGVEHWIEPSEGILRNSNWADLLVSNPIGLDIPFDNPKNINLLLEFISLTGVTEDNIVLDFFAGSCTTAHAVMKLNSEDGGNRQFIMVQLPEPCDENSEAYKAGFENIAEIGKERIRRAGEQIKDEIEKENRQLTLDAEQKSVPDIGFRVFTIDDTNMKDVYYSAAEYSQENIEGLVDNVKEERTDLDLLYQVLIDWGLPLDLRHEIEEIDGFSLHIVDNNALIACFDANIPESVIRKIAGKKPLRAVFRDGSFRSSPGKLNIEGIFKTIAPDTNLRVI